MSSEKGRRKEESKTNHELRIYFLQHFLLITFCSSFKKRMHNTIQELRGNVRVFARVRPFLPGDGENEEPCVVPKNENALQIVSFFMNKIF